MFLLGDRLSGVVIDFYFACNDFYAYNLAICLNAWCFEPDHSFNATKARLMIGAYHKVRPIPTRRWPPCPCSPAAARYASC